MTIDREQIRERIDHELQRQRDALDWYEHRRTWAPTMTEQQKQEHEQYVKDNNLPF
jgi:hypothetical protein